MAKINAKALINQTIKANSDAASNGLFDWVKGGAKYLGQQVDDLTGNRISSTIDESSLVNNIKDTMSTKDLTKRKLVDVDKSQVDDLSSAILNKQSTITDNPGQIDALNRQLNNLGKGQVEVNTSLYDKAKEYYGDAEKGFARAGMTLGAYGALAVGGRYATGGNLTTNNRGESDIAGVPFI